MGTTAEELKKLYYKLGGDEPSVKDTSTVGEIINAINELDLAAQYELPAVSKTDNGMALGVVEGQWNKMDIPKELPVFDPVEDEGKVLGIVGGVLTWVSLTPETPAAEG